MRPGCNPMSLGMTELILTRAAHPPDRIRLEEFQADLFLAGQTDAEAPILKAFKRTVQFIEGRIAFECKYRVDLVQGDLRVGEPVPCPLDPITLFEVFA